MQKIANGCGFKMMLRPQMEPGDISNPQFLKSLLHVFWVKAKPTRGIRSLFGPRTSCYKLRRLHTSPDVPICKRIVLVYCFHE